MHDRARCERLQVERVTVELRLHLRVRGEQDLEAAVEAEAVDDVGAHAATRTVGRVDQGDVAAGVAQRTRTGESCQAGADDHGVVR